MTKSEEIRNSSKLSPSCREPGKTRKSLRWGKTVRTGNTEGVESYHVVVGSWEQRGRCEGGI